MKCLTVAVLFLLPLLAASTALGCTCSLPDVKYGFNNSEIVFEGSVKKVETVSLFESYSDSIKQNLDTSTTNFKFNHKDPRRVKRVYFEKIYNYKSGERIKNLVVYTPSGGASCGFYFEEGKTYLVYSSEPLSRILTDAEHGSVNKMFKSYWTSSCTRTTEKYEKEFELLLQTKHLKDFHHGYSLDLPLILDSCDLPERYPANSSLIKEFEKELLGISIDQLNKLSAPKAWHLVYKIVEEHKFLYPRTFEPFCYFFEEYAEYWWSKPENSINSKHIILLPPKKYPEKSKEVELRILYQPSFSAPIIADISNIDGMAELQYYLGWFGNDTIINTKDTTVWLKQHTKIIDEYSEFKTNIGLNALKSVKSQSDCVGFSYTTRDGYVATMEVKKGEKNNKIELSNIDLGENACEPQGAIIKRAWSYLLELTNLYDEATLMYENVAKKYPLR